MLLFGRTIEPWRAAVLLLVLNLPLSEGRAGQSMGFFGTLVAPPACTINNGEMVDVDFGERVGVSKVDGQNYLQTVNYRITCSPGGNGLLMGLKVTGSATGFDPAALQTNVVDLGIRLLQNGRPLTLNQRFAIDAAAPPLLQAVPVKKPGAALKAGAFMVTATLLADYQ